MNTDSPSNTIPPQKTTGWWWLWTTTVVLAGVAAIFLVAFYMRQHAYQQEYVQLLQQLRAAGEPVTAGELDQLCLIPPGNIDLTPQYIDAMESVQKILSEHDLNALPSMIGGNKYIEDEPPEITFAPAEKLLLDFQDPLQKLAVLANATGSVNYRKYHQNLEDGLKHVQRMRATARVLNYACSYHHHRQAWNEANDTFITFLKFNESFKSDSSLLSQLVRCACHGIAIYRLPQHLESGHLSDAQLAKLQVTLQAINLRPGMKLAFQDERVRMIEVLADKSLEQALAPGSKTGPAKWELVSMPHATMLDTRPGDCLYTLKTLTAYVEATNLEFPDLLMEVERINNEVAAVANAKTLIPTESYTLSATLLPSHERTAESIAKCQAQIDCAILATAIARFRLAYEKLPSTLTELTPEYLPQLPPDVFTDRPYLYSVVGNEFKVYSVGADRIDDGGAVESGPQLRPADIGWHVKK